LGDGEVVKPDFRIGYGEGVVDVVGAELDELIGEFDDGETTTHSAGLEDTVKPDVIACGDGGAVEVRSD
jgi:hypothetical protein